MSRFAAICQGPKARRKDVRFTTLHGVETACDLRILDGEEHAAALAAASAVAKAAGVPAEHGNILFDFALACEIVALAALDPEVRDSEERFFASVAEVKRGLDRERILLLFEAQTALQDEVSPRATNMTLEQMLEQVWEHAVAPEGHELPFERWQPVLRRAWVRFLVDQLAISAETKLPSTSGSSATSSAPSKV